MDFQIYNHFIENEATKEFLFYLAKENRVRITQMKLDKSFTIIAPSTSIVNGTLYINNSCNWKLAFHELCHILSVEEKYRYMLDGCTHKSYMKINKKYGFSNHRTESATIGLNDILNKIIKTTLKVDSPFWNGRVGKNSDVPTEWISVGKEIEKRVYNTYTGFNKKLITENKIPDIEKGSKVIVSNGITTIIATLSEKNKLVDKFNSDIDHTRFNKFTFFS